MKVDRNRLKFAIRAQFHPSVSIRADGLLGFDRALTDGTLMKDQFSLDRWGRKVYFQGDGKLARGLIFDGTTYYQMDEADGHCLGEFPAQ